MGMFFFVLGVEWNLPRILHLHKVDVGDHPMVNAPKYGLLRARLLLRVGFAIHKN